MTSFTLSTVRNLIALTAVVLFVYWAIRRRFPHQNRGEEVNPVECVYHGATLIADGFEFFPDWSASMLREFDDSIEPELKNYYQIAKSVAGHPREDWPAMIREQLVASEADLWGV